VLELARAVLVTAHAGAAAIWLVALGLTVVVAGDFVLGAIADSLR